MACPYLKEGRAQYCHAAPVQKLILDGPDAAGAGRCASGDYRQCEYPPKDAPQHDRCPLLEQVHVQYCGASPVTKLVPFSDSQLSSCTSASYRYCDSYRLLARPQLTVPDSLFHTPNHFWLSPAESGLCHIGVDSFLVDVAGSVDAITFATQRGNTCPAMVLTIDGVDWPMSFPNPLTIHQVNGRVRSDPARLAADPYGAGWLFEGWELPGRTRAGLIVGAHAADWQTEERERLTRKLQVMGGSFCDGGVPVRGVARLLPRQQFLCLFQDFFARRDWAVEE